MAARLDVSVSDPMPQTTELPDAVPNEAAAQTGVFTVEHQATASHGFMLPPDPAARPKASPLHFLLSDPQYGRILDRLELHLGQACTLADVWAGPRRDGDLITSDPGAPWVEGEAGRRRGVGLRKVEPHDHAAADDRLRRGSGDRTAVNRYAGL